VAVFLVEVDLEKLWDESEHFSGEDGDKSEIGFQYWDIIAIKAN
jgi:hypothetical protein